MRVVTDTIKWDRFNWARAIKSWEIDDLSGKKALGLGECEGGLALYFALKGADVICTDYRWMGSQSYEKAQFLHNKYGVDDRIRYEDIDATAIPYEGEFDIIFFKSILGGIGRNGNDEIIATVFEQIYKALKPGGVLYYAENLRGCSILRKFRSRYSVAFRNGWNYKDAKHLEELEDERFCVIKRGMFGCIACMGPNEPFRNVLGVFDAILERLNIDRYIMSAVLKKM